MLDTQAEDLADGCLREGGQETVAWTRERWELALRDAIAMLKLGKATGLRHALLVGGDKDDEAIAIARRMGGEIQTGCQNDDNTDRAAKGACSQNSKAVHGSALALSHRAVLPPPPRTPGRGQRL